MAEARAAAGRWGWLGGVRIRVAMAATAITALALVGVATWLVASVEGRLTSDVEAAAEHRLAILRHDLEAGVDPDRLVLAIPEAASVQVLRDGRVVAASPSLRDVGPVTDVVAGGGTGWSTEVGDRPALITTAVVDAPDGSVELVAVSPLDSVRRTAEAVRNGMILVAPVLALAMGGLAWLLAGRALRPVEAIRAEVEAISGTSLDRRVPEPGTGDEVARLARTMNAMLGRLEEASARQQRFVADASHELRSPVAAIRAQLEVALHTGTSDWRPVASAALQEEARLEATIEDLLALAQLDDGAAAGRTAPVDLAEVTAEEVRRWGGEGLHVVLDAPGPVVVDGVRVQLHRAVANLMENAVRHGRREIRVSVRQREGRARVLVDDDGPGIPEADRERVFERFTRLDESRARPGQADGGAGLGLSLVRTIVERHGGTATVGDAPLGGARVVLDLPLERS